MVASRITSEQSLIAKFEPRLIVTGSNVTIFYRPAIKDSFSIC